MTVDSSTMTSISVFMKHRYASSGVQTIGSVPDVKDVFTITGRG